MGETTKIQWCDHTFNPWIGCERVSPGCAHCYAASYGHRFAAGWGQPYRRTSPSTWAQPLAWDRAAARAEEEAIRATGVPPRNRPRVFCASLADVFDEAADPAWRADLWKLIERCPHLDWLLLTKRPENFRKFLPWGAHGSTPPRNVWLGVTAEDQRRAEERIPHLLSVPAARRFVSYEPALGPVDWSRFLAWGRPGFGPPWATIDWIICGGESGPGARRFDVDWARSTIAACRASGVACFVKQMGSRPVDRNDVGFDGDPGEWPVDTQTTDETPAVLVHLSGKGGDPAEWPEDLRVREIPPSVWGATYG